MSAFTHKRPGAILARFEVETPYNALAVENTREFHGLYHVLHGSLSPLEGIGTEQLKIKSLIERLKTARFEN